MGECRTNYRQLKRGQGLQRAVLLCEIIIGITMALAIRWGKRFSEMKPGAKEWRVTQRGQGGATETTKVCSLGSLL